MFNWSEKFETHIEVIDTQHKNLVDILNKLCLAVNDHELSQNSLDEILKELVDYSIYHFTDEESLMAKHKVSEKHVMLHKMEHHSFTYDIERMCNYFSSETSAMEVGENLVQFITAWLTYHILGMDKLLAEQINDIKHGINPEVSYQQHKKAEFDAATTRLLLDAVLNMWKQCNEHSLRVEQRLEQCLSEKHQS
jgi:hemerythrin-like metal-binding protein